MAYDSCEKHRPRKDKKVPDQLVYELIDGKPIYRRGYKSFLNKSKKIEANVSKGSLNDLLAGYVAVILHQFFKRRRILDNVKWSRY